MQAETKVVAARFSVTSALEFAEFGVGIGACVVDTSPVDTALTVFAGHTRARICFAQPVGTALSSGARGAVFNTRGICGATTFTCCTLLGSTRIIHTLPSQAQLCLGAAVAVASRIFADLLNTNAVTTTICVVFARLVSDTLAVLTSASCRTTQAVARIVGTAVDFAQPPLLTRIALAGAGRADTALADLALGTLNGGARIGIALSVGADLSFGAEDAKTASDASSCFADLIGGAGDAGARIFEASAVATKLSLGARCVGIADGRDAFSDHTERVVGAIFVKGASGRGGALAETANLPIVGASDTATGITRAGVGVCAADPPVFADV